MRREPIGSNEIAATADGVDGRCCPMVSEKWFNQLNYALILLLCDVTEIKGNF